jgi:hypothetical protein
MRIRDRWITDHRMGVVGLRGADKDPGLGPGDRARRDACIFQRFPGQLQQNPLLRIHLLRLAGRDAEHARVEAPNVFQHPRCPGVALATLLAARVPESLQRKPVVRNPADRALAFEQQRPEIGNGAGARKSAGPTDDGNVVMKVVNGAHPSPRNAVR